MNFFAGGENATMQPSCGQTASKAANFPASGCTTMPGSPDLGSWNVVDPPTGTALAAATRTPAGFFTDVVVGDEVAPEPVPVDALVGGEVDGLAAGVTDLS